MLSLSNRIKKVTANDFNLLTTSTANLDRESKDRHFLSVTCKDSDVNQPMSSSIDLVIDVTDVNDNPPFIPDCPKEFSLKEGNEPGLTLGEIVAFDIDLVIRFYIHSSWHSFKITSRVGLGGRVSAFKVLKLGYSRDTTCFHYFDSPLLWSPYILYNKVT